MTVDEIFGVVAASIREVEPELENRPITPADSLKLLGLPSVARVEVLMLAMETLGIAIPNGELVSARNLGDLVGLFELRLNQNI
jgi:polyketide biosynthesis acyl carrier protein